MSVTSAHSNRSAADLLRAPATALNGVSESTARVLRGLEIETVFDLATASVFESARRLAHPRGGDAVHIEAGRVPAGVLDATYENRPDPAHLPLAALAGLGAEQARELELHLGSETISDLADWPPFLAARALAGYSEVPTTDDPEIPTELVPKLNEHATERASYAVYAIDPIERREAAELRGAVDVRELLKITGEPEARTGRVLTYEQSWTPVALTLGNLLHSIALAPGESTRIAMVDWQRRQGVSTTESVSQLESLVNLMQQNRAVNEITRAVARESQQGFSNTHANSTVSNSAYTAYGIQNPEEALLAAGAGAMSGAGAGALAGGVAGGGIGLFGGAVAGGVLGSGAAGIGAIPGAGLGAALGLGAGSMIGTGSGALVGGAAGGALGFMGAAAFGSSVDSGSTGLVDVVTTTGTFGDRAVESDMLQHVNARTQQHSSNSRNRRASIVQEVAQSESESVSTRVVTNYNHMHALTIQYFEVVQLYAVRTRLVGSTPCLYIPIQPIRWTPELVARFRRQLLAVALTPNAIHGLTQTMGTVALRSPTFPAIPAAWFANRNPDAIDAARRLLDDVVSTNPFDGWRLPETATLFTLYGTSSDGGSPFGGTGSPETGKVTFTVRIHTTDGEVEERGQFFENDPVRLGAIRRVEIQYREKAGQDVDFAAFFAEPVDWSIRLSVRLEDEYGDGADLTVPVYYRVTADMVQDNVLTIPLVVMDKALSMRRLLEHLDENTHHYTRHVLRARNSPLVASLVHSYGFQGTPLANLVDPEPIAVTGDNLVFKLHDGEERATPPETQSEELVPVGTGGVFAEAVQGRANAAERLDLTRFWNWQDSPIPILPPEIAPVVMGSRARDADIRPGALGPAALQQQTGATLPDALGTAAVLGALQSDLFRDMSGLAESAQLAQSALQSAAASAQATGSQASETLQKGMEHTRAVVEKVTEMTGEYGKLLAEKGFGLIGDVAKGAMGMSGASGGTLGGGSPSATAAGRSAIGPGASQAAGPLGQRNASLGGAVLNEARRQSGAGAAAGPAGGVMGAGSGAAPVSGTPPSPGVHLPSSWHAPSTQTSLPDDIVRSYGGAPSSAPEPSSSVPSLPPPPDLAELMPALEAAGQSDRTFFAALDAALTHLALREQLGAPDDGTDTALILRTLTPAWKTRVDQAIADANGGDLTALAAFDQLVAAAYGWPGLSGSTDLASLSGQIRYHTEIVDLHAPSEVVGGEPITVTGRFVQTGPDGTTAPVANARVSMLGQPMEPRWVEGVTDADGRFSLTATHGVPPAGFAGVHRHEGWFDLALTVSGEAPHSALFAAVETLTLPGRIDVQVQAAWYEDDGSSALIGSVVAAPVSRIVNLQFRVSKAGQPLVGHSPSPGDVTLNGAGQIGHVSDTDDEGLLRIQYLADDASTDVAYVGLLVRHGASQQAGAASIDILDV